MQIEITLTAPDGADYAARDLGFLLHKHPDHLHVRDLAQGRATIFYPVVTDTETRAVIHLAVDPIALVRGKANAEGLLDQYVNDRPYAVNSLLAVALGRAIGQTLAGKSKDRQALADRALPFRLRLVPLAVTGGLEIIERLFAPLGYDINARVIEAGGRRPVFDLHLSATARLADILTHCQVLIPVLDNAKHYFVDEAEVETLLAKGSDWLSGHPERELIAKRALKNRRHLVHAALDRLGDPEVEDEPVPVQEEVLEQKNKLHDLRLDTVRDVIVASGAKSVLDLGCGEGKLLRRLVRERGIERIVGVDASVRTLEVAADRLHLDSAGASLKARLTLQLGSLTYGDRRWSGFDAATLVEVIEHIDPPRLSALELSVFGTARPGLVVVTTPNRDYNALFEGLADGRLRHADHRFEWSRAEFAAWAARVATTYGYGADITPLGPLDETLGGPSQMAVLRRDD